MFLNPRETLLLPSHYLHHHCMLEIALQKFETEILTQKSSTTVKKISKLIRRYFQNKKCLAKTLLKRISFHHMNFKSMKLHN